MLLPSQLVRQLTEEHIAFIQRSGLKAEVVEPGHVRLRMPLAGNQNHLGSLYAGALFTLAEVPGGALFLSSFDSQRFIPLVKAFNLRFLRPALSDITVEACLDAEQIAALQDSAERLGKAEFSLALQLQDNQGQVVALSEGLYQIRKR